MKAQTTAPIKTIERIAGDDADIRALDLAPAKCALKIQLDWGLQRILDTEREYREFLRLIKSGTCGVIAPSADVDAMWHMHILDTRRYAEDCQRIFGRFIHHDGWAGYFGEDDANRQHQDYLAAQDAMGRLRGAQ